VTCRTHWSWRRRLLFHATVLALLIPLVACTTDLNNPDGFGYGLSGRVTNAVTQQPIAGATVTARQRAVTGSDGRYTLGNLQKGSRLVRVTHPDYRDAEREIDVTGVVTPGDFSLTPK